MSVIKKYPVAFFGSVQTLLLAVLTLLSAFDVWSPTDAQRAALLGVWAALTAIITSFIHGKVTPVGGGDA